TAGNYRRAQGRGILPGNVLGNKHKRPNQTEILLPGVSHRRQGAKASRKHCVPQKRFAEVVGCMAKGNDVGAEFARDLVDGAPSEATAEIAPVIGLLVDKPKR